MAMMVLVSASSRPAGNVHDIRVIKNGGNWKMHLVFASYLLFLFKKLPNKGCHFYLRKDTLKC